MSTEIPDLETVDLEPGTVKYGEETYEITALDEAARDLVGRADGNARMAAQVRKRGEALIIYPPGEIPLLDQHAAQHLQAQGMEVGLNTQTGIVQFPGRQVVLAGR